MSVTRVSTEPAGQMRAKARCPGLDDRRDQGFLAAHPEAVDSRKYLVMAREAMAEAVTRIIDVLDAR